MHKASVEERLKLKRMQIDVWSTKEQLCLASSVLRSGDQNWVSVSRSVRMFGDPKRPADWFSQKNCALQYASLLENEETPKRKRGERGDGDLQVGTPGESIVQKLTNDRIEELKKLIPLEKEKHNKLREEVLEIRSGQADHKLPEISQQIEEEKRQKQREEEAYEKWLKDREEKINEIQRAWKPQGLMPQRKLVVPPRASNQSDTSVSSETEVSQGSPVVESMSLDVSKEETLLKEEKPASTPTSPLLTSLLKSPSPAPSAQASILHSAITAQRSVVSNTTTPTISSLLAAASPTKREAPTAPSVSFSPGLSNLVSSAISSGAVEVTPSPESTPPRTPAASALAPPSVSPSAGAPTLSMLLELPPSIPGTPLPELPPTQPLVSEDAAATSASEVDSHKESSKEDDILMEESIELKEESIEAAKLAPKEKTEECPEEKMAPPGVVKTEDFLQNEEKESDSQDVPPTEVSTSSEDSSKPQHESETKIHVPEPSEVLLKSEPKTADVEENAPDSQDQMSSNTKTDEEEVFDDALEELPQDVMAVVEDMEAEAQQRQAEAAAKAKKLGTQNLKEELEEEKQEMEKEEKAVEEVAAEIVKEVEKVEEKKVQAEEPEQRKQQHEEEEEEEEEEPKEEDQDVLKEEELEESDNEEKEDSAIEISTDSDEPLIVTKIKEKELAIAREPELETVMETEGGDSEEEEEEEVAKSETEDRVSEDEEKEAETKEKAEDEDGDEEQENTEEEEKKEEVEQASRDAEDEEEEEEEEEKLMNESEDKTSDVEEPVVQPFVTSNASSTTTRRRGGGAAASTSSTPVDSVPNSPASVGGMPITEEEREYRSWKKSILLIWSRISAHKYASIFLRPITEEQAPGYESIVYRPMDLTTIKRNVESGAIRSTLEFQRDLMLIFLNAIMYNNSDHVVPRMAQQMQEDCLNQIEMFIQAQESNSATLRRETREASKRHDSSYVGGDGYESEPSRSAAPSPLPLKRKRTSLMPPLPLEERSVAKKRRTSLAP